MHLAVRIEHVALQILNVVQLGELVPIIDPAIEKHNELRLIKAREPKFRSTNDFIEDKGLK